ncbi:hypothetical protein HN011_012006 [Eciton burchellii]|nr:hypothetical protein HN011_012006 [Eciton burchellii]
MRVEFPIERRVSDTTQVCATPQTPACVYPAWRDLKINELTQKHASVGRRPASSLRCTPQKRVIAEIQQQQQQQQQQHHHRSRLRHVFFIALLSRRDKQRTQEGSRCGWGLRLISRSPEGMTIQSHAYRATCMVHFADISGGTERMYPGELRVLSHTVQNCHRPSRRHTRNHQTMPRKLLEDRRGRTFDEHRSTARQTLDSQR